MRTSLLSRSVIAVASLAIGSVALAATPASAAGPDVITRDLVLALAQAPSSSDISDDEQLLVDLACDFETADEDYIHDVYSTPFVTDNADGVLVTADLHEPSADDGSTDRYCTFAAMVTTDEAFTLSGNALITLTGDQMVPQRAADLIEQTATAPLSGNLFVTEPINVDSTFNLMAASLTTTGNATRSVNVTTSENVTVAKPKPKSAVTKYAKRLKAAKKWYAKKIAKAGNSSAKKAAASKAYAAKKAAYKKAYDKVYYTTKAGTKTTVQTENRPFDVTVDLEMYYTR